jgi:hypothetical protein
MTTIKGVKVNLPWGDSLTVDLVIDGTLWVDGDGDETNVVIRALFGPGGKAGRQGPKVRLEADYPMFDGAHGASLEYANAPESTVKNGVAVAHGQGGTATRFDAIPTGFVGIGFDNSENTGFRARGDADFGVFFPFTEWKTGVVFVRGWWVWIGTQTYESRTDHVSGSFEDDLAAGKWTETTGEPPYSVLALRQMPNENDGEGQGFHLIPSADCDAPRHAWDLGYDGDSSGNRRARLRLVTARTVKADGVDLLQEIRALTARMDKLEGDSK